MLMACSCCVATEHLDQDGYGSNSPLPPPSAFGVLLPFREASTKKRPMHCSKFWLLDHIIVRAIVVSSVRAAMIFARPLDGTLSDRAILLTDNRHEPISLLLS
jgi:hypothetical protein